jgi:hypothetical protein
MIAELEQRVREFESARHRLAELVVGLSDAQFNRRPHPARWSMAECIDHLLVVGWLVAPRLITAIVDGKARGWYASGPFRYGALGNWFVKLNGGGDRGAPRLPLRAPPVYRPRQREDWKIAQALREFSELQEKFSALARAADGLDLARIKAASPVTRFLRLSLGQWLALMAGHQERHLAQAARVREDVTAAARRAYPHRDHRNRT